jgi:hypothetical protein
VVIQGSDTEHTAAALAAQEWLCSRNFNCFRLELAAAEQPAAEEEEEEVIL